MKNRIFYIIFSFWPDAAPQFITLITLTTFCTAWLAAPPHLPFNAFTGTAFAAGSGARSKASSATASSSSSSLWKGGNGRAAKNAAPPPSGQALFEYIPDNYDLFIYIRPAEFFNELSIYPKIKAFFALTPLKSVSAVRSISLFIAFGRHQKGNIDFIAAADMPDGFDYDKFIESLTAAAGDSDEELIRTGDYEGKKILRVYNLAGCRHGSKLILSSASGMKKVLAAIKAASENGPDARSNRATGAGGEMLAAREEFAGECARARGSGSPLVAVIGNKMLAAAAGYFDEGEFAYKKEVGRANFITFDASGRTLKIRAVFPDAATAGAFKSSVDAQTAQSIKDSAEALAEVDLIETESAGGAEAGAGKGAGTGAKQKLTRLALKEIVYARKLLKFTLALNKSAKTATVGPAAVEITATAQDGLFKAIDELICVHPESWGLVTKMFLSSEAGCARNARLLETAALLYLAKYPEKKSSITAADIFESELVSDYLKCPEGAQYDISVDAKGKITVKCGLHGK